MAEVRQLALSNLQFSLDLLKNAGDKKTNMLVSPFSIGTAMAMVLGGARNQTSQEMKTVMKMDDFKENTIHDAFNETIQSLMKHQNVTLLTANKMYLQKNFDILSIYQALLETSYQSTVSLVDFVSNTEGVRKEINEWVENLTHNKIKDLIAEGILDALTRLVLVNAVYFKGNWSQPFDPALTKPDDFHLNIKEKVVVDMMYMEKKFPFGMQEDLKCQIVELPYVGESLGMYIILPNDIEGLEELENRLDAVTINQLIDTMWGTEVHLTMPKLKMESMLSLKDTLYDMGMTSLFIPNVADLSGISSSEKLHVSAVIHKTFLEVNEEGTEAAAATAVQMCNYCYTPPKICVLNHPFLLMIRDKNSGMVLFLGRVMNPS